ncbi:hypothetical protein HC256_008177 [Beauveria bassiana]|nr:hypothetical protein HC256_008177 [Beauveria bassiana]
MSRQRSYCGPDGPASTKQIVATSIAIINAINHVVFTEGWSVSGSYTTPWRKQILVCYGEAYCDGTRALVLEDVGGVSLYHRSALVEMSEEQMAQMILASYRLMISLNIAYDDWKLDNLYLVDGRVVFLDMEYVYELDFDPERAIQLGRAAILERWHQFREQYHKYGEIEM